jgi:hypothetical protein
MTTMRILDIWSLGLAFVLSGVYSTHCHTGKKKTPLDSAASFRNYRAYLRYSG